MEYIVYSLNSFGYPEFNFVVADSIKAAKKEFHVWHPLNNIQKIYISTEDMRNFLTSSL